MIVEDRKIQNPTLRMVGDEADRLGLDCYVVGGWVRDLFLHRESTDVDIVCVHREGDESTSSFTARPRF